MEHSLNGQAPEKTTRKGNIVLKKLTSEQKQDLMLGKVGLAGIAIGAGAFALMGFLKKGDAGAQELQEGGSHAAVITTHAPFAEGISDGMSFQEAFQAAREEVGPGGFFEHNGKLYNTYTQDEWNGMSPEMQQQYWSSIDQNVTSITDVDGSQADSIGIDTPVDSEGYGPGEEIQATEAEAASASDEVILEVDYVGKLDLNKDGVADVLIVDANGNDLPDLVFDDDFDGVADRIVMDIDVEAGLTGKEESYDLEGVELKVNNSELSEEEESNTQPSVASVDYISEFDSDDDGYNDVIVVDADGNDTPELLIDRDRDGKADIVVYDVDTETGMTGNEEIYGLEGVEVEILGRGQGNESDRVTSNDTHPDALSETDLNPGADTPLAANDAPNFDNDYDVSDYS